MLVGWLFLLQFVPQTAWALDPQLALTQYGYDVWLRQNGLPATAVNAVYPSSNGYLWLATTQGLVRFDGVHFTLVNIRPNQQPLKESVTAIAETKDGTLWVGTETKGLRQITAGKITAFTKQEGIDEEVRRLYLSRNGSLWVGTANGLFEYNKGQFKAHKVAHGFITGITEDSQGTIYVSHHKGVNVIRGEQLTLIGKEQGLADVSIQSVFADAKGNVWIGGKAFYLWRDKVLKPLAFKDTPQLRAISSLAEDRNGNLWIATRNDGLFRLAGDKLAQFNTSLGLSNDSVRGIAEDREGSLWIATGEGLNRLKDVRVVPFTKKEGLVSDSIRCGVASAGGTVYLFNNTAEEFTTINGAMVKNVPGPNGPSYVARDGSIWIGGWKGLQQIKGESSQAFLPELKDKWISCVSEDEQGIVFFVDKVGLYRFSNGEMKPYLLGDGTPYTNIEYHVALFRATNGTLWAGTTKGLIRFGNGTFTQYKKKD